jgi:long-chain fatty acid transport protein
MRHAVATKDTGPVRRGVPAALRRGRPRAGFDQAQQATRVGRGRRLWWCTALAAAVLAGSNAHAGGIGLYEVGTPDVGLASAGYAARAQDAATVLTNPAGMTRLDGNQLMLGAQVLYGDVGFSVGEGTSPALGSGDGGNPVGWFPGGGVFYSHSLSPDLKLGLAVTGNFGSAVKYDEGWVGRYRAQDGTLLGVSILPSIATRIDDKLSLGASLNLMYGTLDNEVAVNNIAGPDGRLSLDDSTWGVGVNLGLLYELDRGTRLGITYTSPVKLDFGTRPAWSGLGPGLTALLASRGLLDARTDIGVTVPQGVNAGVYHQLDPRWAVLGSVGWQQWSKFGAVDVGIDANDPVALTTGLEFDDTWQLAGGAQYRWSDAWLLSAGIAYDSGFQSNGSIALALPTNAAWRFGIGGQTEASGSFGWGWSLTYATQGTLRSNVSGNVPVALGGRGDVVGSYDDVRFIFLALNVQWKP